MSLIKTDGRRVVHTRDNTTFEEWKKLLMVQLDIMKVDKSVLRPLSMQHAWEMSDTPVSYAAILKVMQDRRERNETLRRNIKIDD
jgi:hypothetical protein